MTGQHKTRLDLTQYDNTNHVQPIKGKHDLTRRGITTPDQTRLTMTEQYATGTAKSWGNMT